MTSTRLPPIAAQRARNARMRRQAENIARSLDAGSGHAPIPVIIVPANSRESEPLPAHSRDAFLARLQATVHRVFAEPPHDDTSIVTAEVSAAARDATTPSDRSGISAVLGRSCATCRGECCTAGGEHAFLRDDSISRVRAQHVALSEIEMVAAYAAHLPARHYRGSCVYHTTDGCALPRDLRSNLCNRYICGGLSQVRTIMESSGGATVYVAAADSVHLRRMALIDATDTIPIALT